MCGVGALAVRLMLLPRARDMAMVMTLVACG